MVVPIYAERGRLTFAKGYHAKRPILRIAVPEGSQILPTVLFGPQLFVPVAGEPQALAWGALELVRAAEREVRGFRLV